jgi:hypothetical protein
MDRDAEIIQINHDLDVLRARYATYERSARMLRIVFMVWLPLVAILILAAILKVFIVDALMGSFFAGMVGAVCLLLWLLCGLDPRDIRWIDVASAQLSPFSMNPLIPFPYFRRGSDARMIKKQIDQREQRLRELGQSQR